MTKLEQSQALYIKRLEEYLKDDWIKYETFSKTVGMELELMNINDGEYDETCQERIKEFEAEHG